MEKNDDRQTGGPTTICEQNFHFEAKGDMELPPISFVEHPKYKDGIPPAPYVFETLPNGDESHVNAIHAAIKLFAIASDLNALRIFEALLKPDNGEPRTPAVPREVLFAEVSPATIPSNSCRG